MGTRLRAIGTAATLVIASAIAFAHDLELFATVHNGIVEGSVFTDDGPVPEQFVQIVDSSKRVVAEVRSDNEGKFRVKLPGTARDYVVVCETADGHRAEFALDDHEPEQHVETTPRNMDAAAIERIVQDAIARELHPLREQLAKDASRVRIRDIIGGVGYIAGVFGLIALMKRRT